MFEEIQLGTLRLVDVQTDDDLRVKTTLFLRELADSHWRKSRGRTPDWQSTHLDQLKLLFALFENDEFIGAVGFFNVDEIDGDPTRWHCRAYAPAIRLDIDKHMEYRIAAQIAQRVLGQPLEMVGGGSVTIEQLDPPGDACLDAPTRALMELHIPTRRSGAGG